MIPSSSAPADRACAPPWAAPRRGSRPPASPRCSRPAATPSRRRAASPPACATIRPTIGNGICTTRSEEHTSELQTNEHLVCRLMLENKQRQKKEDYNIQQQNTD